MLDVLEDPLSRDHSIHFGYDCPNIVMNQLHVLALVCLKDSYSEGYSAVLPSFFYNTHLDCASLSSYYY
jgi:hypothetical protein